VSLLDELVLTVGIGTFVSEWASLTLLEELAKLSLLLLLVRRLAMSVELFSSRSCVLRPNWVEGLHISVHCWNEDL